MVGGHNLSWWGVLCVHVCRCTTTCCQGYLSRGLRMQTALHMLNLLSC